MRFLFNVMAIISFDIQSWRQKGPLESDLKRSTVNKIDRKNKGVSAVLANAPL